jgi:hypothetical protein
LQPDPTKQREHNFCFKSKWIRINLNCLTGFTTLVSTSPSFPHSWLITGCVTRLTRRVSLVEQELHTLPEHLSSPLVFSGVLVTRSLVLCACFVGSLFFLFLLAIVLSVCWFTDYDYPYGIFKLFLWWSSFWSSSFLLLLLLFLLLLFLSSFCVLCA